MTKSWVKRGQDVTLLLFSSIRYIFNTTSGEALIRARQPGTDT
jgi:hypothetical protein